MSCCQDAGAATDWVSLPARELALITDPMEPGKNPAVDAGARLPGFNDDFTEEAPDIGAFESGRPPLRFGREMAPGFERAPWERY